MVLYHAWKPKKLGAVKPFYSFAVKHSGHPEKLIYQRRQHCPCPNCFLENFENCMYSGFLGEWNVEEMKIEYVTKDPAADLQSEHDVTIQTEL